MQLYGYFRSSAAFRVRTALALKRLSVETIPVHLRHGEHLQEAYRAINPHGLVPLLVDDGSAIAQSMAIVEYLDETHPAPPLMPLNAVDRAWVRGLAQAVACDIHPVQNLRILKYLRAHFGADDAFINEWCRHWIATGFDGIEAVLASDPRTGRFCYGDAPGFADIFLIPQTVNAVNFGVDMTAYPTIQRVFDACMALPAFAQSHPKAQPDAE